MQRIRNFANAISYHCQREADAMIIHFEDNEDALRNLEWINNRIDLLKQNRYKKRFCRYFEALQEHKISGKIPYSTYDFLEDREVVIQGLASIAMFDSILLKINKKLQASLEKIRTPLSKDEMERYDCQMLNLMLGSKR